MKKSRKQSAVSLMAMQKKREPSKKLKMIYDDFHAKYFKETFVESVEKQSEKQYLTAKTRNRADEFSLKEAKEKMDRDSRIIMSRSSEEQQFLRESLRRREAHRLALLKVQRMRQKGRGLGDPSSESSDEEGDLYGRYGTQAARSDLQPSIDQIIVTLTPSHKREKLTRHLLRQRKPLETWDRSKTSSALLTSARNRRSRLGTRGPMVSREVQTTPQLTLPSIEHLSERTLTMVEEFKEALRAQGGDLPPIGNTPPTTSIMRKRLRPRRHSQVTFVTEPTHIKYISASTFF